MLRTGFAALACAFMLAESLVVKKDEEACANLLECASPLQNFLVDQEGSYTSFAGDTIVEVLDNFCQTKDNQAQCFRDIPPEDCDSEEVNADVEATVASADYVCSDRGRQTTLALAESECASDDSKQQAVNDAIQRCTETFEFYVTMLVVGALSENKEFESSELCPFADSWVECIETAADDTCGSQYRNFFSEILAVSAGPRFEQLGCAQAVNVKRQLIRRAFDFGKRWSFSKRAIPVGRRNFHK